jgi:transposase
MTTLGPEGRRDEEVLQQALAISVNQIQQQLQNGISTLQRLQAHHQRAGSIAAQQRDHTVLLQPEEVLRLPRRRWEVCRSERI